MEFDTEILFCLVESVCDFEPIFYFVNSVHNFDLNEQIIHCDEQFVCCIWTLGCHNKIHKLGGLKQ